MNLHAALNRPCRLQGQGCHRYRAFVLSNKSRLQCSPWSMAQRPRPSCPAAFALLHPQHSCCRPTGGSCLGLLMVHTGELARSLQPKMQRLMLLQPTEDAGRGPHLQRACALYSNGCNSPHQHPLHAKSVSSSDAWFPAADAASSSCHLQRLHAAQ